MDLVGRLVFTTRGAERHFGAGPATSGKWNRIKMFEQALKFSQRENSTKVVGVKPLKKPEKDDVLSRGGGAWDQL
jgi:hypothetical protein